MKTCVDCNLTKELTDYHTGRNGYVFNHCKPCATIRMRKRREAKPEQYRATYNAWEQNYKPKRKEQRLKRKYGIDEVTYQRLFTGQDGKCAICKREQYDGRRLAVDHDHANGQVRGLLCTKCNQAIGLLMEDASVVQAAFQYLLKIFGRTT